jgi:hypothetical protein
VRERDRERERERETERGLLVTALSRPLRGGRVGGERERERERTGSSESSTLTMAPSIWPPSM